MLQEGLTFFWTLAQYKFHDQYNIKFQCDVKRQTGPHVILDSLKSVVTKNAQVGCGQALFWHSVVLQTLLEKGPTYESFRSAEYDMKVNTSDSLVLQRTVAAGNLYLVHIT